MLQGRAVPIKLKLTRKHSLNLYSIITLSHQQIITFAHSLTD